MSSQTSSKDKIIQYGAIILGIVVISILIYWFIFGDPLGKEITDLAGDIVTGIGGIGNKPTEKCAKKHPNQSDVFGNIDGSCWRCPDGYARNSWSILPTESVACMSQKPAHIFGKLNSKCPSGYFTDPSYPRRCWKCPSSHPTRTLSHVNGNKACGKNIVGLGGTTKASFIYRTVNCNQYTKKSGYNNPKQYILSGTCFACPKGYRSGLNNPLTNQKACINNKPANKLS